MRQLKAIVSRIRKVFDGDTFRCDIDEWPKLFGYNIRIRIRGINCCELSNKDVIQRALAERAKQITYESLTNANQIILTDIERGKFFRLIADVSCDGQDLGAMLLSKGLAVKYHI